MKFYLALILSLTLSFISFAQQSPCDDLPELLSGSEFTVCPGDSVSVTVNYNGYDSFQWADGSTDTVKWLTEEEEYIIFGTFVTGNLTSNGDFQSGNTGFSSEYTYNATTIWNEGTYAVTTDANLVHANLIGLGHGGTGNFMAINGTGTLNEEVWCQDVVVEPNTNYDFSTWVSSISPINPASLQFSIDGDPLGAVFNAPATTGNWIQFNATWFSGTATTIEICITNQNTNLNGNDFGIDDIEFIAYCQNTDTVELEFFEVGADTIYDTQECVSSFWIDSESGITGTPGFWEYLAPPGGPTNVTFFPNNTDDSVLVSVPELGEYIFSYVNGCADTTYLVVDVISVSPILDIVTTQACDFEFDINVTNSDVQNGTWSYSSPEGTTVIIEDITEPNTAVEVSDYGTYTFTYTFGFCEASFSQDVIITEQAPVISVDETLIECSREVELTAVVPGQGSHWVAEGPGTIVFEDFEATTTTATVSQYGVYSFYYFGCNGVDTVDVEFAKKAPHITVPKFVDCGMDAVLEVEFEGEPGNWIIQNTEGDDYELNELDNNTATLSGEEYGQYIVQYVGCDTSVEKSVVFFCDIIIPNVFTPNNDAINQEFTIERLDSRYYDRSELNVFNRWGLKVYHNGQYGLNGSWWDGKDSTNGDDLMEGVYYFTLNLHNHLTKKDEKYSGTINLRR